MPSFPIVDSHVHLYDPGVIRYGWMRGRPILNSRHLLEEYDAARGPVEVAGIVFVEVAADPGLYLEEASFVAGLAERDPRLWGMVAHAPLERGAAVTSDLEKLASHALIRGIRRLIQREPEPGFCLQPKFIEGVKLLPRFNLSFDICIYHHQMADAIELVRRCPEVRFVLDHIGKPGIKDGLEEPWRTQLKELAGLPNVWCKLSGVATEADHAAWTRDQLRPYILHAVECFGFDRVMYGADWPVSEEAHRYPEWVAIIEWALSGSSEDEFRKLFRDNATAFYRLEG